MSPKNHNTNENNSPQKHAQAFAKLTLIPANCRQALLQWFAKNKEDFFFRTHGNPYITWVSEIALQQTRMNAALQKLKYFLERFPDLPSLALADSADVMAAFAGLGYYNRAKNLHKGAAFIYLHYGAEGFPNTWQKLKEVAGIGDYTAAAILSISFDKAILAIDGNIRRIYQRMRLQALPTHLSSANEKEIRHFFAPLFRQANETAQTQKSSNFDKAKAKPQLTNNDFHNGDINEALMQLGQKVCTLTPRCLLCPLAPCCSFAGSGYEGKNFPPKSVSAVKIAVTWNVCLLYRRQNGSYLFFLQNLQNFFFLGQKHDREQSQSQKKEQEQGWGFPSLLAPDSGDEKLKLETSGKAQEKTNEQPADEKISADNSKDNKQESAAQNFLQSTQKRKSSPQKIIKHEIAEFILALPSHDNNTSDAVLDFSTTYAATSDNKKDKHIISENFKVRHLGNFKHSITKYNIRVQVYACDYDALENREQTNLKRLLQKAKLEKNGEKRGDFYNETSLKNKIYSSLFLKALQLWKKTVPKNSDTNI